MKGRSASPEPILPEGQDPTVDDPEGNATSPQRSKKSALPSEMIGVRELVAWLGFDRSTIHRMHDRGDLPAAFKLGGSLRWYRRDIEAWLEQRRVQRGPVPRRRGSRRRTRRASPPGGSGGPHA